MLASGEPMLWLAGGALAICAAMIIGLLLLVLRFGMGTFWPTPLYEVTLRDGTVLLGEVTRFEQFRLTRELVERMPPEMAAFGRTVVADGHALSDRWLLRTGNFELTNEHFNWVSDVEIAPGGVRTPEWGILLERMAWGRFYGYPQRFTITHQRSPSGEESELRTVLQFIEANQFLLEDEPRQALAEPLDRIRGRYDELRRASSAEFLAQFAAHQGGKLLALVEGGGPTPLNETPADAIVDRIDEVYEGNAESWAQFEKHHGAVRNRFHQRRSLERFDIGEVNHKMEAARLGVRQAELDFGMFLLSAADDLRSADHELSALGQSSADAKVVLARIEQKFGGDSPIALAVREMARQVDLQIEEMGARPRQRKAKAEEELAEAPPAAQKAIEKYYAVLDHAGEETASIQAKIDELNAANARYELQMKTADGAEQTIVLGDVVRGIAANRLSLADKVGVYLDRWREFLLDEPREANSEGGVFPAIWGTVVMTLIMSFAVVPFGVLAALYLREYAKGGLIVSVVRIAINNLAGVPSIVFGVFGLGFFCYIIGAYLDGGGKNAGIPTMPPATWWATVVALALVAVVAFFSGISSFSARAQERSRLQQWLSHFAVLLWVVATVLLVLVIFAVPQSYFGGFYEANLPNPTFGKGGLIWASLTLALLTLPVVIVATEEALSAVPNSLREGSYACGASKWQTIKRIVLPHAMPGIMTGMILAMARGAGEVAPLMLVGAVKLALELPLDFEPPFLHPSRSFMHLGFHIFDVGFQSQNSEAAKPLVFSTTLLLIGVIFFLNITAVMLRARLRKRFHSSQF